MIYLAKNQDNYVITDSIIDYLPSSLDIYLDSEKIGSYANISTDTIYLIVDIPSSDISSLENREYKLRFVDNESTIKEELCVIRNFAGIEVKSPNKSKQIKFYE